MARSIGNKLRAFIKYTLIVLGIVFIVLIFFLIREATHLERSEIINIRETQLSNLLQSRGPLTINDVGIITSWMTFDYINKLFKLSPDYLKTTLNISNPKYPQISISGYAKSVGANKTVLVGEVQTALRNYFISKNS